MIAYARIDANPLGLDDHVRAVSAPHHGAVATFMGLVRDHDPAVAGRVTHLEYSAHPDAAAVLERIATEVCAAGGDALAITAAVSHRIGRLAVGEPAIVAAVASAHREQAFATCRELVERIKAELPVWKREILADGSHVWVGVT